MRYSILNQPGLFADQTEETTVYKDFEATELYCPRCRRAVPVRKRLLLVLPEGEKFEYRCALCLETVGTKLAKNQQPAGILSR